MSLRKMLKKPLMLSVIAAIVLAVTFVNRPVKAQSPVTIRIFVGLGTGTDQNQQDDQLALAKLWNDAHPDIQIKFEFNDYASARDVLLTQVASGNVPDIVGPVGIRGLNETGDLWADLSPYINKEKAALKLDDFEAATLNLYSLNGKDVAIPLGIYPSFLYVNKDIFDQAGIALPPTDYNNGQPMYQGKLWTMDALRDIAIKLSQDKNGNYADESSFDPKNIAVYGYADVDVDMRGYAELFSPGHSGVAPDGKTAIFNDKTYLQAMQWRYDGIFKDHFFPDAGVQKSLTDSGNQLAFQSGAVAIEDSHTWALDGLKDVKFNWVAAVTPVAPNGKLTARINADTFALMDKGQHKDQAWEVLKWLTSTEISAKACNIYGCLPARISARASWETQIKQDFPKLDLNVIYGAVKYLDNPNSEANMPNYSQAFDAFSQELTALDSDPGLDVTAEMNKLNTQEQAIFDGKAPTETPAPAGTAAQ